MTTEERPPAGDRGGADDDGRVKVSLPTIAAELDLTPSLMARWRRQARAALKALADSHKCFTVEDLVDHAGPPPKLRQVSGAIGSAQRSGLIEQAGTTLGSDGRLLRVWRGAP